MINIYKKISELKKEFSTIEVKKSGKNAHLGFKYHELSDFLGIIAHLNVKYGVAEHISIDNQQATLTLTNVDEPSEQIKVSVPFVMADMQTKNDSIQKLGATLTYLRRYLYVQAYAITEHDVIDAQNLKEVKVDNDSQAKKFFAFVKQLAPNDQVATDLAKRFLKDGYDINSLADIDFSKTSLKQLLEDFKLFFESNFE
jgi:hypothetical protein